MAGKFEVYEDKGGKFRFRLKASNGQVVAVGEAYETLSAAKKGTEAVQRAADGATVVETEG
ncbi:MAG: YegP family protein [Nocardioides sp.]|uniref:YegP family protein n=1 Tax=Nocardioides sp. TaxID=35761 RepID=UPI0039E57A5B